MSRADSGIVFTGSRAETPEPLRAETPEPFTGSRAETPEPIEEDEEAPAGAETAESAESVESVVPKGEEETTVGGKVVALSNGSAGVEGGIAPGNSSAETADADKLKAIPEEALGVGVEQGTY